MLSTNRRRGNGEVYNDVRCLSTDTKPTDVRNGSTLTEIDTGKRYLFDADSGTWHEFQSGGGGGSADIDLGITGATVGQFAQVASVDESGAPMTWDAANGYTLTTEDKAEIEGVVEQAVESHLKATVTVTAISDDGATVTGQTVTFFTMGGAVYASMAYEGQPVSLSVPKGTDLTVSMSDAMPNHRLYGSQHVTVIDADVACLFTYHVLDYTGLVYNSETGRYTNDSIEAWLARHADGLTYGVSIPKSIATECYKTGANASMPNPVPGIPGRPAVDPYVGHGPFLFLEVNGGVEEDGTPYVTAVRGMDGRFARDGSNGDVWVLAPRLCWATSETDTDYQIDLSDTKTELNDWLPQTYLPDGTLRPYYLFAKYGGVKGADGYMHSYSGLPAYGNLSHNALITACRNATTGYSGKSVLDLLYVQLMHLLKYATKHAQSVFAGCTNYSVTYNVTVAQEGESSVIIPASMRLLVGSTVTVGTSANGTQKAGPSRVLSVEDYDAGNVLVTLDCAPFDSAVNNKVSTYMWHSGSCDSVEGDGGIDPEDARCPYVIQGIECAVGHTEILGDVIVSNDGTTGWVPYVNPDSRTAATSLTSAYESTGRAFPTDTTNGWKYALYPESNGSFLMGATKGGSQTTGICDGQYTNTMATTGTRELLSVGYWGSAGGAGPFFADCNGALAGAWWNIGSRLSATGRSRG